MILEIQTLGDSFEEVEDAFYEAASVYGLSEDDVDQGFQIDDFGSIIEVTVNPADGRGYNELENKLVQIGEDLDLSYDVQIL